MTEIKKYVVVLAHADGWGAVSANNLITQLHKNYPDVAVHLVVSQATKDKEGKIATKLDDLKTPRELKETNLLEYFRNVDTMYEQPSCKPAELLTFNQLAKHYCADGEVHYTSRGGPKGGEEVAAIVAALEKQCGQGPEVLLSVDTMAILPKELLERYQCCSAHPGPLDTIKVEGMQGTLRSLVNQVLYDAHGEPLPVDHVFGMGMAHIKGTLFMQHPELDKGPPVDVIQTFVCPGMCAYQARSEVYHELIDAMLKRLPQLLDKDKRAALVEKATREKAALDALPNRSIPELEAGQFATWQGQAIGFPDDTKPWGVDVVQNAIVDHHHFENQMHRFFPGAEKEFGQTFGKIYGQTLDKLAQQQDARLTDPWARLFAGDPDVVITQYDPKTGKPVAEYKNPGPKR